MTVSINRTGERFALLRNERTKYTNSASEMGDAYGFKHIDVLDVENYGEVLWEGIEYNRLLQRDGVLYRFVEWLGRYPYDGIIVEKIGTCS
jgi:hypothetical protein